MTHGINAAVEINGTEVLDPHTDLEYLNPGPDDPDFQMTISLEDLQKRSADIKTGRVKTIPWEEVKRDGHALRG